MRTNNFVELLRVDNGEVKKLEEESQYNLIRDYFAARTYDESGDYVVNGLGVSVDESLNDGLGNGGVYTSEQTTEQGATPSEDLLTVKVSSGKAYVRGYDVKNPGTVNLDAPKTRTTENVGATVVPFEMGSLYVVNNVTGTPAIGLDINDNIVQLWDGRLDAAGSPTGQQIGEARVYNFGLEDAPYSGAQTPWELYLYDLQIFTKLTLNQDVSSVLSAGFRVKGKSSNATGFVRSVAGNVATITEVSGEFVRGEQIAVNGRSEIRLSTTDVVIYGQNKVSSIFQNTPSIDPTITTSFSCDTRVYTRVQTNFSASDAFRIAAESGGTSTVTCPGRVFDGFAEGDIVVWQNTTSTDTVVNLAKVASVAADELSMEIEAVADVTDVCNGDLPTSDVINANLRASEARVLNTENSFLYAELDEKNISEVNLGSSQLFFTAQITGVDSK